MPRNVSSSKGKKQEQQKKDPLTAYDKLELAHQIACYKFWLHLNTAGSEGWSTTQIPGSVFHYGSSNYINTHIKQTSWSKIGKVRLTCMRTWNILRRIAFPPVEVLLKGSTLYRGRSCKERKTIGLCRAANWATRTCTAIVATTVAVIAIAIQSHTTTASHHYAVRLSQQIPPSLFRHCFFFLYRLWQHLLKIYKTEEYV